MAGERPPGAPAVQRLVETTARSAGGRIDVPRRPAGLPQGGVDHVGIAGLEGHVDGPGVGVVEQRPGPGPTAIGGAEHAALRIGTVGMAERGCQQHVRVARIDQDLADLLGVLQPDGGPGGPAVGRAEHAFALGDIGAHVGLARADVDDVAIARGHGQGADGAHGLGVEDRGPGAARVVGAPDPAIHRPEVEPPGLVRCAGHRQHPPAAERADGAPVQRLEQRGIDRSVSARRPGRSHRQPCGAEHDRRYPSRHRGPPDRRRPAELPPPRSRGTRRRASPRRDVSDHRTYTACLGRREPRICAAGLCPVDTPTTPRVDEAFQEAWWGLPPNR